MLIRNVQLQMLQTTLKRIDNLSFRLENKNRSEVVQIAVDIAYIVVKALSEKKSIIIEDLDGKKTTIVVPGIST